MLSGEGGMGGGRGGREGGREGGCPELISSSENSSIPGSSAHSSRPPRQRLYVCECMYLFMPSLHLLPIIIPPSLPPSLPRLPSSLPTLCILPESLRLRTLLPGQLKHLRVRGKDRKEGEGGREGGKCERAYVPLLLPPSPPSLPPSLPAPLPRRAFHRTLPRQALLGFRRVVPLLACLCVLFEGCDGRQRGLSWRGGETAASCIIISRQARAHHY